MKTAWWENNKDIHFLQKANGELLKSLNWCMSIYVDQSALCPTAKRYMISFIDDYSRKFWVYFLVVKFETFSIFKKYKNRVEKETSLAIKGLRTDCGWG